MEAQAYEMEQRAAMTAEVKKVLDSWVQYEGQVKQREQRELAEGVMAKIRKELENPKMLQQILQQSVTDVESKYWPAYLLALHPRLPLLTKDSRYCRKEAVEICSKPELA